MLLWGDCHVGDKNGCYCPNLLVYTYQSANMAMQSMADRICVGYSSRENEKLFSACKIIMLSHYNNYLSALFRRDTRLIDLVHCVMKYSVTFEQVYNVQSLQAQPPGIALGMQSSQFLQNATFYLCCRSTSAAKLSLKGNAIFTFFTNRTAEIAVTMSWVSFISTTLPLLV